MPIGFAESERFFFLIIIKPVATRRAFEFASDLALVPASIVIPIAFAFFIHTQIGAFVDAITIGILAVDGTFGGTLRIAVRIANVPAVHVVLRAVTFVLTRHKTIGPTHIGLLLGLAFVHALIGTDQVTVLPAVVVILGASATLLAVRQARAAKILFVRAFIHALIQAIVLATCPAVIVIFGAIAVILAYRKTIVAIILLHFALALVHALLGTSRVATIPAIVVVLGASAFVLAGNPTFVARHFDLVGPFVPVKAVLRLILIRDQS